MARTSHTILEKHLKILRQIASSGIIVSLAVILIGVLGDELVRRAAAKRRLRRSAG